MKTFLFCTTTEDRWQICGGSYLVNAESKEKAEAMFENLDKSIYEIIELDLSVKGQIEIQHSIVE